MSNHMLVYKSMDFSLKYRHLRILLNVFTHLLEHIVHKIHVCIEKYEPISGCMRRSKISCTNRSESLFHTYFGFWSEFVRGYPVEILRIIRSIIHENDLKVDIFELLIHRVKHDIQEISFVAVWDNDGKFHILCVRKILPKLGNEFFFEFCSVFLNGASGCSGMSSASPFSAEIAQIDTIGFGAGGYFPSIGIELSQEASDFDVFYFHKIFVEHPGQIFVRTSAFLENILRNHHKSQLIVIEQFDHVQNLYSEPETTQRLTFKKFLNNSPVICFVFHEFGCGLKCGFCGIGIGEIVRIGDESNHEKRRNFWCDIVFPLPRFDELPHDFAGTGSGSVDEIDGAEVIVGNVMVNIDPRSFLKYIGMSFVDFPQLVHTSRIKRDNEIGRDIWKISRKNIFSKLQKRFFGNHIVEGKYFLFGKVFQYLVHRLQASVCVAVHSPVIDEENSFRTGNMLDSLGDGVWRKI